MELPNFHSYGDYSSSNYGAHTMCFTDARGCDYYFSYKTLVAFRSPQTGLVCRENDWNTTTGKHLNWIQPDHKVRVNRDTFFKELEKLNLDSCSIIDERA